MTAPGTGPHQLAFWQQFGAALTIVGCFVTDRVVIADDPASYLGATSCASATCHGGSVGSGPAWQYSLSVWFAKDPHAEAGRLLRDEDSKRIVELLDPKTSASPAAYDDLLRQRCISCHTTVTANETLATGRLDERILDAGVSCESCHGAASKWLDAHVHDEWVGERRFDGKTGMRDTESVLGRSQTCVRCHVGSRTEDGLIRDMNHDLIAAGHPALRFDLLIYIDNLPHHWSSTSESEQWFTSSAVKARRINRAVNLAAASSLASERAEAHLSDPKVPFPELADYDCFACHQSLTIDEFQLPPRGDKKSPWHVSEGLPVWNSWHTIQQLDLRDREDNLLQRLSPHRSDPKVIASSGQTLAARQLTIAKQLVAKDITSADAIEEVRTRFQSRPPVDWNEAAITYLDLDAITRDLTLDPTSRTRGDAIRKALTPLEQMLRFQTTANLDSSGTSQSPKAFSPKAFQDAVLKLLGPPKK